MRSLLVVFWLLNSFVANAGVFVENGGDSINCSSDGGKYVYDGMYVLDYSLEFPSDTTKIYRSDTVGGYLDHIEKLLTKNTPELLPSFQDFRRSIPTAATLTTGSNFGSRTWLPTEQPLRDIQDEKVRFLSSNCREGSKGIFIQTVVRKRSNDLVMYSYDLQVMGEYIMFDPLQASIILIHEWLWDFFDSAIPLRRLNAFLHSKEADFVSKTKFRFKMKVPLNSGLGNRPSR